jgi:hypothetical protein
MLFHFNNEVNTMKIMLIVILFTIINYCIVVQGSEYSFISSTGSILALGQVVNIHYDESNHMTAVDIINIRVLLRNSGEAFNTIPDKMTVHFYSGLIGLVNLPRSDSAGRSIIFTCIYRNGLYIVPDTPFIGVLPNGENMMVFSSEEEQFIPSIERILNIIKLKDPIMKLQQLENVVNDSKEPVFLKKFCIARVAEFGGSDKSKFDPHVWDQLIKWRDDLDDINLQGLADLILTNSTLGNYEWSEERLAFLRIMKNKADVPEHLKQRFMFLEDKALKDKLEFEERKPKNVKSGN